MAKSTQLVTLIIYIYICMLVIGLRHFFLGVTNWRGKPCSWYNNIENSNHACISSKHTFRVTSAGYVIAQEKVNAMLFLRITEGITVVAAQCLHYIVAL